MSTLETLDLLAVAGPAGDMDVCRGLLYRGRVLPAAAIATMDDDAIKHFVAGILIGASFAASAGAT